MTYGCETWSLPEKVGRRLHYQPGKRSDIVTHHGSNRGTRNRGVSVVENSDPHTNEITTHNGYLFLASHTIIGSDTFTIH